MLEFIEAKPPAWFSSEMSLNGFTDDEVAAAKKTYADDRTLARSQDGGLTRLLARNVSYSLSRRALSSCARSRVHGSLLTSMPDSTA